MPTLLLRFDSPMQSWGTTLKLKNHDTQPYPSKSGVIGMIGAAIGIRRDDDKSISDLVCLKFGVRIDRQGTIIDDFHVSEVSEKEKKIGHRKYLSDACFTCGIEADEKTLDKIKYALLHPAYPLFAGRRGCPVTAELVQDIVPEGIPESLAYDSQEGHKTIIFDSEEGFGGAVKDIPVSFSPFNRQYRYRFVEIR